MYGWQLLKWLQTFENRHIFQQLSNYSQAHLTEKTKLVEFWKHFLSKSNIFSFQKCGRHARYLREKFLLQVEYKQLRLTISHARRLSLTYQRIPSVGRSYEACSSNKTQNCLCKNNIGDLTDSCCYHTSGMHFHLRSNLPLTKKIQSLCIFW